MGLQSHILQLYNYIYFGVIRPIWQWAIFVWTGKPEIVRLMEKVYDSTSSKCSNAEYYLSLTKCARLKLLSHETTTIEKAIDNIIDLEQINLEKFPRFKNQLSECLSKIIGYYQLISNVEHLRSTAYCSSNDEHEKLLLQLWSLLRPSETLRSRISNQWSAIGFQGDDPMTDFRGMGVLSLQNLVYLASHHTDVARQLLSHSHHPVLGYSLAITGINITYLAVQLLRSGHLKTHFYNAVEGAPCISHFHQVYCYLLYEFDKFWFAEKPRDVMEFNIIREKFYQILQKKLNNHRTVLVCEFAIDTSQQNCADKSND